MSATETRPSTFITAEQARASVKHESSYDVFQRIQVLAEKGDKECFVLWNALAPETMQLLGAGGYQVRRGGVDNEYAIITW